MTTRFRQHRPLAAALLLAFGHADASGAVIEVNLAGDSHVDGRCILREAVTAANTHAQPTDTNCTAGGDGGNTIAIPPALAVIELHGGPLDIADPGGETTIRSAVSGVRIEVQRVSGSGPVFTASRPVAFEDVSIAGGRSDMAGGGISAAATTVTLTRCLVSGNHSNYFGGGILVSDGATLSLVDTTISGNTTGNLGLGGGIAADDGSTTVLTGSTVSGNTTANGGGLFVWRGHLRLVDSTVSGNAATADGGGIATYRLDSLDLIHSTITGNTAPVGAGIRLYSHGTGTSVTARGNLLTGNTGAPDIERIGNADEVVGGDHNLIGSAGAGVQYPPDTLACDPQLLPLADNGGPTRTHALDAGSCALDAGGTVAWTDYDQRGEGHPRLVGAAVDIGAYEYDPIESDRIFASSFD